MPSVRVPATSANLGPGFDALGLALGLHDELDAEVLPGTLEVHVTGEGAEDVPRDSRHLVVRALAAAFSAAGAELPGLRLTCRNRIPHGRGLGSSAAAVVAGVLLGRELLAELGHGPLDDAAALELTTALEGHPDNVAPCLLGGFTIAWTDERARAVRLDPHPAVRAVAYVPEQPVSTEHARSLLPAVVPHADAAYNAGRAALLVEALTRSPHLLLAATEDRLHQAYREPAMPASAALVAALRSSGAAAVVSGAGPTVLALHVDGDPEPGDAAGFRRMPLDLVAAGAQVG
ncbi:homoserine kinase [Motilibacter rhizosphaerae]|uniref:Homoserine kinase n=1 Tax=Motilibacter rhizosphaerae TaxID=598652 RepID=A0A4Q7NPB5_9ACTN|nr:homoserine kinase [Motilibacter rhizosphaerae]RZS87115.1 homoserine kinase [Motilibacter rhizosphaerae]